MISTTIPRTQTGLVPTSHHVAQNKMASPDNWSKLPPRPPPEVYPFRGDRMAQRSEGIKPQVSKKPPQQIKKSRRTRKKQNCSKKEPKKEKDLNFDTFTTDEEIHKIKYNRRVEINQSKMESLKFIRQSAWAREQLSFMEQQMEYEIESEAKKDDISRKDTKDNKSMEKRDDASRVLHDFRQLKEAVMKARESDCEEKFCRRDEVLGEIRGLKDAFLSQSQTNRQLFHKLDGDETKYNGIWSSSTNGETMENTVETIIASNNEPKKDQSPNREIKNDLRSNEISVVSSTPCENLWSRLSPEQRLRIKSQMEHIEPDTDSQSLRPDETPNLPAPEPLDLPLKSDNLSNLKKSHTSNHNQIDVDSNKEIDANRQEFFHNIEENSTPKTDKEVVKCMNDIVSKIAESLFKSEEKGISGRVRKACPSSDKELLPNTICYNPEPQSTHPYDLPLSDDVKMMMISYCKGSDQKLQ